MKKRIRVAVKRLICLVTICALTVGACPLPIAAAEQEGVTVVIDGEQDGNSSTQQSVVAEPIPGDSMVKPITMDSSTESIMEEQTTESTTEEHTTESTTEEHTTESTTEEHTTESITEEHTTESTTEEHTTEPTTEEHTTELTTEEYTTEPTTEEHTAEPTTQVDPVDTIELTVSNVNVSDGGTTYQYQSGAAVSRYFTIGVNGSANIKVTASENTEEVIEIGEGLAEDTSIVVVMEGPNGVYQTIAGSVEANGELEFTASVSGTFEMKETGDYTFYTVVTDAYGNEQTSQSFTESIAIPSAIGVVIENPVLSVSEEKQYPETGICTTFHIPCSVDFAISLTGLDGEVSTSQRAQEIKEKLSQYRAYFSVDNTFGEEVSLDATELSEALITSNGSKVFYKEEATVKVKTAGVHNIYAKVNSIEAESVEITIEKLVQSLDYQSQDNAGNPYEFQKDITCWLSPDSIYAGEVVPVVTDEAGNEIAASEVTVTQSGNQYLVHATNLACNEDKTYTITFSHSGNDIYESASKSIDLTFKRTVTEIIYEQNFTNSVQQYQKEITYTIPDHIDSSKVLCYEVDADGTKIENGDLNIEVKNNQVILYHTNDDNVETSTHTVVFEYLGDSIYTTDKQEKTLEYSKLKQDIQFTSNPSYGTGTFPFSKKSIEFEILNSVGEVTYYESNEKGEKLPDDEDKNLVIKKKAGNNNVFTVKMYNKNQVDEAFFYMTFEYTGNQVYSSASKTIKLHCVRENPKIGYQPDLKKQTYRYDDQIVYTFTSEYVEAENIEFYESDANGEPITDGILHITREDNQFIVTADNSDSQNYETSATHYITFAFGGNEDYQVDTQTFALDYARQENDIAYTLSSSDKIYEYGEVVTLFYDRGAEAGGISCYQSDAEGNRLDGSNDLMIKEGENGSFLVSGQNLSPEGKPFYVTVAHAEDGVYLANHKTFDFNVVKINLNRNIDVQELENGIFFKTRKMYVDVFISAQYDNLTQEGVDAISFELKAISNTDDADSMVMEHKKPVVSYDKDKQEYCFHYEIEKDFAHKLAAKGDYKIEATAGYGVNYFEDFTVARDSVKVEKSDLTITWDEETSRSLEYSKECKKISYEISGENFEEYPVGSTAVVGGDKNIEITHIDNEGFEYKILKAGTAHVVLTVDDTSEYDAHNEAKIEMDITITSPSNTDYTINGKTPEAFLQSAVSVPTEDGEEKWYKDDIIFTFGEDNLYTQICYKTDKEEKWHTEQIENFVISESMPTSYEYYFCDTEIGIYSNEVKPNMTLSDIGVDQTNPSWNTALVVDRTPSEHSNNVISYFPTGITITGYAGSTLTSDKKVDAGSGIEKVLVQYGNSGVWEEIAFEDRYSNRYELILSENKNYGSIKLKTVDYLGHESEVAEYTKVVCVDDVIPVVVAVNVDETGNTVHYDGTWTNQQLRYAVDLLEKPQVSGIYQYEWAFVLRGTGTQPEEITEWTKIDKNELEVIFGTIAGDKEHYAQKNGTLYFRAQSNAGLTTTEEDILKQKKEIRIWQEELEPAKITESIKPDSSTGWYNVKTGEVSISFEYPVYDEENCAPAIGIVYTLATKTNQDGEANSETRRFFKGIFAELTENGVIENVQDDDLTAGIITIDKDSINTLSVHVEDAAGNQSEILEYEYRADFIVPDILSATAGGTDIKIHKNDASGALYSKFSQSALSVDAEAEYGISEKQNFYMAVTQDKGGKESLSGGNIRDSLNIEPCTRGYVYLCAVDGAGNQSEAWTDGIVVDNQAPTGGSQQEISIVMEGMNSAEFFNKDVEVTLNVADAPANDHYSGLKNVTYTLGRDNQNTESDVTVFDSQTAALSWEEIKNNHDFETDSIVINAAQNESNHAFIEVTATDYAGNVSTVTKELQIDVTNPQIEIIFEQNDALNETYYKNNRVARIDIKELNFDPSQVGLVIYKDGAEEPALIPAVTSWNTTEGNVHSTYITFAEDGDYSFEVTCTDLAGNEAEKVVSETFTIDKTKPVVEVSYDNNNAWKENYYSQARTATITVTEHNFNPNDFEAIITPGAVMGSWTHNEDVHRVSIYFDQEQHYTYYVNYTDLAGNMMDAFAEENFYIDMNSPVIQISGVEDRSANAGDVIPVVLVSDQNYDIEGVQITLQNSKGQQIAVAHTVATLEGGYSYTLMNVNEQPDEIYTLTVIATDMSGNQSELTYRFSLNRNGSVYDLSQMSALVDKAYVRYMNIEDLQIYEMNVNTVEEFNIIVTRNGKAVNSIERGARPQESVQDAIYYATNVEGNDDIGYEYEYTIYRESFQQEGIYNIMFYSRDKAGNEVNNTLTDKKAEITFVVDNSAPMVVVEGVEPGELYTEETKDVNVYVSDNFKLQEAYFELVDEDGNALQTYNYMELAEEEGDIVTITLPSSNKKMSIQYYALDVAGNDITTMPDEAVATSFMITTNAWIRYINNKKAVAGTVCVAVLIVVASAAGVFFRRRKL
ncbi:MAG: hypothetical protein IJO85_12065 [Lachnospiraceae bacterium]|nr:hypothetical protein [Lachnospiraceae bacterium]